MCLSRKQDLPGSFVHLSCSVFYKWKAVSILSVNQRQQKRPLLALHKHSTGKDIQRRKESFSRED